MLEFLNTYRSFLYRFLLAAYLLSVIQVPVFELVHLLSHTHEISSTYVDLHSYAAHHEQTHDHFALQLLDDSTSDTEDPSKNTHDLELKKNLEINPPRLASFFLSLPNHVDNFSTLKKPTSLHLSLIVPPPQALYPNLS